MKKTILTLIGGIILFALSACGGNTEDGIKKSIREAFMRQHGLPVQEIHLTATSDRSYSAEIKYLCCSNCGKHVQVRGRSCRNHQITPRWMKARVAVLPEKRNGMRQVQILPL